METSYQFLFDSRSKPVLFLCFFSIIAFTTLALRANRTYAKSEQKSSLAAPQLGVNARFFDGDRISIPTSAVFWFGDFDQTKNHADVRVGYNPGQIQLVVNQFDRELFYDKTVTPAEYSQWDSVDVYLRPKGSTAQYLFKSQLSHDQPDSDYQVAYKNSGNGFTLDSGIGFETQTVWYGGSISQESTGTGNQDRGWYARINIPFDEIGVSQTPATGAVWEMMIITHDRDDLAGNSVNQQMWPPTADPANPDSWGELRFGQVADSTPFATQTGTVTLRHGVDGVTVPDTHVGGGANCGDEFNPDFFNGWAEKVRPNAAQINIQNQMNVEDWPCFSKYFISFPMDEIPAGKEILSAELTVFHFGNAGGGGFANAAGSTIQVMTLASGWDEATANWRNSPLVVEHVAEKWVLPITTNNNFADPAIPVTWDLKSAVSKAYVNDRSGMLHLALYEADWNLHSGKYFYSSDAPDDYNRPMLKITYGDAAEPTDFIYLPLARR